MDGKPTHEQAQLHLQVYDLRREARLRQARDWFAKNYIVNSLDDAMRIAAPEPKLGVRGMVSAIGSKPARCSTTASYMKTSFSKPAESFSGSGNRFKPIVPEFRERFATTAPRATGEGSPRYESWAEQRKAWSCRRRAAI